MTTSKTICVGGVDVEPAKLLKALYGSSRGFGMGMLHYTPEPMTLDEAEGLLADGRNYFDYLQGRLMKARIDETEDGRLYDRDLGEGAFARAVALAAEGARENDGG